MINASYFCNIMASCQCKISKFSPKIGFADFLIEKWFCKFFHQGLEFSQDSVRNIFHHQKKWFTQILRNFVSRFSYFPLLVTSLFFNIFGNFQQILPLLVKVYKCVCKIWNLEVWNFFADFLGSFGGFLHT